jgi:hypothetical protein
MIGATGAVIIGVHDLVEVLLVMTRGGQRITDVRF